jgi:hypothetical protein
LPTATVFGTVQSGRACRHLAPRSPATSVLENCAAALFSILAGARLNDIYIRTRRSAARRPRPRARARPRTNRRLRFTAADRAARARISGTPLLRPNDFQNDSIKAFRSESSHVARRGRPNGDGKAAQRDDMRHKWFKRALPKGCFVAIDDSAILCNKTESPRADGINRRVPA